MAELGIGMAAGGGDADQAQRVVQLEEELQRLHARLAEREEELQRYHDLFDCTPLPYQSLDENGGILAVNQAWCQALGYTPEEVVGRFFGDFVATYQHNALMCGFPLYKARGHVESVYDLIRKNGETLRAQFVGRIGTNPDGSFRQTHCVFVDITERERLAGELGRAQFTVDSVGDSVFWVDEHARVVEANEAACRMLGYSRGELIGKEVFEFDLDFPRERWESHREERRQRGVVRFETRYRTADGRVLHVEIASNHVEVDHRTHSCAIVRDISERLRMEEELRCSAERMNLAFEAANDGIWDWSLPTDEIFWSPRCYTLLGYQPDAFPITKAAWLERLHPDDRQAVTRDIAECLQGRSMRLETEYRIRTADGRYVWQLTRGEVVEHDLCGDPLRMVGLVSDLTERKEAEAERLQTQELLRLVAENAQDLILRFRILPAPKFEYVSPSATLITGYTPQEHYDNPGLAMTIVHPEDLPLLLEARESGRSFDQPLTVRWVRKDDEVIWVELRSTAVCDTEGNVVGVDTIARDVTAREQAARTQRSLEEQLAQAQKMEAIGLLAGGVAHDFNNLLTVILGYSQALLEQLEPGEARLMIEEVEQAGQRAGALTRQLLAFARRQVLEARPLDLNEVIAGFDRMLRRLIGEDIRLVTRLRRDIGQVEADPSQIEQVLLNLAVNARDAMPRGGTLTLETQQVTLDEDDAALRPELKPGTYIVLVVSDTGCGMDAATRERVFEPFFSTKERGQGTGLGLSTVHGIVKQHNGHINVYSEPEHGTTFRVYLPQVAAAAAAAAVAPAAARGSGRVLVVEDDPAIRKLTCRILTRYGYDAVEAQDASDALDLAATDTNLDLLLTDVVMPQMSGREVAERIMALRPSIKVLFMSGYTDDMIGNHGVTQQHVRLLQKPFTAQDLTHAVLAALAD